MGCKLEIGCEDLILGDYACFCVEALWVILIIKQVDIRYQDLSRLLKKSFEWFDRLIMNGLKPMNSMSPPFAVSFKMGRRHWAVPAETVLCKHLGRFFQMTLPLRCNPQHHTDWTARLFFRDQGFNPILIYRPRPALFIHPGLAQNL
jgi:hypothetical protein